MGRVQRSAGGNNRLHDSPPIEQGAVNSGDPIVFVVDDDHRVREAVSSFFDDLRTKAVAA